jgi:hypothetical protein
VAKKTIDTEKIPPRFPKSVVAKTGIITIQKKPGAKIPPAI